MKHIKSLFLIIAASACTSLMADPITPSRALEISKQFMPQDDTQTLQLCAKRSGRFDGFNGAKGYTAPTTAPYYIVSRGAGKGFVIVSGDDCLPQVLGVVEQGDYDENDMPESLQSWLRYRADQVEYAQAKGINTPYTTTVATGRVDVPFLVKTLWHQGSPYNDRCPKLANGNRAITGCVATATSQIAYYWRKDANKALAYDTPTYSYGAAPATSEFRLKKGTPLKWDLMLPQYGGTENAEYKDAVATLMAAVGMSGYLEYGESTGGQISDMIKVLSNQLGLNGGTCLYKSDDKGLIVSEAKWSELLYNQLIKGRPVLYCGYANDSGGHAVVCDGYNASTGFFHINFGWGANYNGYFSLEDGVQGWGFNDSWTGCVYDIFPTKPNVSLSVDIPETIYRGGTLKLDITAKNNGTLPCEGLYLFAGTSLAAPSNLTAAKDCYTHAIASDATAELTLSAPVTGTNTIVYITNENLKVLYKTTITAESATADLHFKNLAIDASADKEEMDGEQYAVVYNTNTAVNALIENKSDKPYYGTLQISIYGYNNTSQEWESKGTTSALTAFDANATATATFSLSSTKLSLKAGQYYYAVLSDAVKSTTDKVLGTEEKSNIVRFTIKSKDMAVVSYSDNILKLKGHFDQTLFNSISFATKSTYKTAVGYDLTDCQAVQTIHQSINPNALYYVSEDSEATGRNIVKGNHAAMIDITSGYTFQPKNAFSTDSTIVTNTSMEALKWYIFTAPASLNVPDGMIALEKDTPAYVKTMEAGKTYRIMTSYDGNVTLCGGASTVATAPLDNTTGDAGTMMGTFYEASFTTAGIDNEDLYKSLAYDIAKAQRILDKYSQKAAKEYVMLLSDAVKDAEKLFSYHESDAEMTALLPMSIRLQATCEEFIYNLSSKVNVNIDCTVAITNPSFERAITNGWTVGSSAYARIVTGNNNDAYRGVGLDGSRLLRNIKVSDSTSVSLSQTVKGLEPGVYRLTAKVGTSIGRSVTVFAGDSTTTVAAHPNGPLYLTDATIENITVNADEDTGAGSLTIGIKAGDWYKADDFRLTYIHSLKSGIMGDLNNDGKVTMQDANIAINSKDGHTITDAKRIMDIFLGK